MSSSDVDGRTKLGSEANDKIKEALKLQTDLEQQAADVAPPQAVASSNVGKDGQEAYKPDAPAAHTAEQKSSPLLCGPILRYTRQSNDYSTWHGTALIVLNRQAKSTLRWKHQDKGAPSNEGAAAAEPRQEGSSESPLSGTTVESECFFEEKGRVFHRFNLEIPQGERTQDVHYVIEVEGADPIERSFAIPGKTETHRIVFHSCNGFCDGAEQVYSGPTLWKDVLEKHERNRFHVLIGGGDQIYCDGIHAEGAPLHEWSELKSGRKKAAIRFTPELRAKVDQWYFTANCDWFCADNFRQAVAAIPSMNIYDDHDIIDGFGSYKDRWQRAPVFVGIGEIAWKYMCLFQHHINPNTTENPNPDQPSGKQNSETESQKEPSYVVHPELGPYIKHRGISIVTSLGPEMVFAGFDCRTDRTQKRVCYQSSYDAIFDRLEKAVTPGKTKHLLVLLGVPIAYPRLVWLETAMAAPSLVAPLRLLHKTFGVFGSFFNDFDGAAELLDDMQDHWACGLHKKERARLILRLQDFALKKKVRVTILSGDVHLAAVGRFYSKKKLNIPQERDHRYMVNVISSAITNAAPPAAVAQVLNQRNKLHHLDRATDENLMKIWNVSAHDNSSRLNQTTYPARNYCIIRMVSEQDGPNPFAAVHAHSDLRSASQQSRDANKANGEAGKQVIRAKKVRGTAVDDDLTMRDDGAEISHGTAEVGALSVAFQIELGTKELEGKTKSYAFSIPTLHT